MEPSSQGEMVHYFALHCLEFLKFVSAASQILHDTLCVMCDSIKNSLTNYLSEDRHSSTAGDQTQTACHTQEALAELQDLRKTLELYLQNTENLIKDLRNGRNKRGSLLDDHLLRKMDKANSVPIKFSFPQPKYSSELRESSLATSYLAADRGASNVNTSETNSETLRRASKHSTVSEAAEDELTDGTHLLCAPKVTNSRDKSKSLIETLVGPFDASAPERRKERKKKDEHHSDDSYQPTFQEDIINVGDNKLTETNETGTSNNSMPKKHKKCKKSRKDPEFLVQDREETCIIKSERSVEAITTGTNAAVDADLELAMLKQLLARMSEPIYVVDRRMAFVPSNLCTVMEEQSEDYLVENSEEQGEQNHETMYRNLVVSSIGVENQACNAESSDTTNTGKQLPKNALDDCIRLKKEELVKGVPQNKRGACSAEMPEKNRGKHEANSSSNINVSNSTAKNRFSNIESCDTAEIYDQVNILTEERYARDRGTCASARTIKETSREYEVLNSSFGKNYDLAVLNIINQEELNSKNQFWTNPLIGDEPGRVKAMMNAVRNNLKLLRETESLDQSGLFPTNILPVVAENSKSTILPVVSKKFNFNSDTIIRSKNGGTEFDKRPIILSDEVKIAAVDSHDRKHRLKSDNENPQESSKEMSQRIRRPCSSVEAGIRRKGNEISEETITERHILMPTGALEYAVVNGIRRVAGMEDDEVDHKLREGDDEGIILMEEVLELQVEMKKRAEQITKHISECKKTNTGHTLVKELQSKPKTPEQIIRFGHKYYSKPKESETREKLKYCDSEEKLEATIQLSKQNSARKVEKEFKLITQQMDTKLTEACQRKESKLLQKIFSHLKQD